MGLELLAGGAILGGIAGAVKGKKGTAAQQQTTSTTFAPPTSEEQQLRDQALSSFLAQQQQIQDLQGRIGQFDPLQQAALQAQLGIVSGDALKLTQDEADSLNTYKQSIIDQGTADINQLLDQRLQQVVSSAAGRGLRGQALGQLQGQVLKAGAEQAGQLQRDANRLVSEQAINAPYRRIQAQTPFIQQGLTLADQMRQQAIQNRELSKNLPLLDMLTRERMGQATQSSFIPGKKGSWGDALLGGLTGAVGGATGGLNLATGFQNLDMNDLLMERLRAPSGGSTIGGFAPQGLGGQSQFGTLIG